MVLQKVDNVYDLEWAPGVKYGDVRLRDEVEQSQVRLRPDARGRRRSSARGTATCSTGTTRCARPARARRLVLPALEQCLKCSHLFNVLDASGNIGVTERTAYILRVRQLAVAIAKAYAAGEGDGAADRAEDEGALA